MIKGASPLVQSAGDYIFKLFKEELPAHLIYHDFTHTYDTVKAARELAKGMGLSEEDRELVMLAMYFHDTGYIQGPEAHEERSAADAEKWLSAQGYNRIETVKECIMATRMPQQPKGVLQEICCDSDLSVLASEEQAEKSQLLRLEWEEFEGGETVSDVEWLEQTIDFITKHRFHTSYAHINWNPQKYKNAQRLRRDASREKKRKAELEEKLSLKRKDMARKETKEMLPDRGIETMFRTASRTHINLSSIADNKANIMLSINALIISVLISGLGSKFDTNPALILPTFILIMVCVLSIVFATLSTRPKITEGKFTRDDIKERRTNLLFFGNFYNMKLSDYEWGMDEMMKDKSFLYGSLTRDLYFLGVVLARKYKLLRNTYTIFMYGLIIAIFSFIVSLLFWPEVGLLVTQSAAESTSLLSE